MDSSFNKVELRFLLAEMIKVSQIDVHRLVEFVRSYEVQPDWMSMQLPLGRNMNQCISAAQAMGLAHLQPPLIPSAPIKRKSVGDLNNEPPPKKLAMTQIELQPTPYQRLQPRPSPGGPNSFPAGPVLSPTVPPPNPPKKRGRPTKANKEAQARNGSSGSLPPILAPMPLAPRDPAPPPAQDPGQNPPFAYRVSPGPRDPKTKKRGGKGATPDKSQPRGMPENALEQMERSPALGNLISPPPTGPSAPQGGPAIPETTRRLTTPYPPSPAPAANMNHIRNDNHAPLPSVNTKA